MIKITEDQLSAALENLFQKATLEVLKYNDDKEIEKIAVKHEGILYYKSRLLECAELKAVGHLADSINIENFTGVNFRVPLVDQHSPLGLSIALYMHYDKYPHRGAETLHRMSLQFCKILKGRKLFTQISIDCIYCKKIQKKLIDQVMGPLAESQTTISPVFYFTMVDLWGPLTAFVPGYEKVTRTNKPHEVYMMVFVCCATGTVNCQIIEGKDTGFCLDGFNRFFCETTVPKICFPDREGGLIKSLSQGEIDITDLSGTLRRQRGIIFEAVVPQGHYRHGKVEKRIHMLQQSLERSQIRNSRCTATGWQTLAKLIERSVNSIPIGFLHHQSGGLNPLLRILTPNSLKLITTSDRAPIGVFNIPDGAAGIMENIDQKYETWYQVWNEQYLPLVMDRQKWHFRKENLIPGDIVYFKLTESKMSADWRIGKVEAVKIGKDGYVREATIAYKNASSDDPSDWTHRTVDRPVRNMVKLFHIDDTCLMDDIRAVNELTKKILEKENLSFDDTPEIVDQFKTSEKEEVADLPATVPENDDRKCDPCNDEIDVQQKKIKKKRKTEIEKLEIQMKGWTQVTLKIPPQVAVDPITHQAPSILMAMQDYVYKSGLGEVEDEGTDCFETFYDSKCVDENYEVYLI